MRGRDILLYGGLAAVAYLLYKKFSNVANTAANAIAQPIANAYVDLTAPSAPIPQGSVLLPDGSNFPASDLTNYNFGFRGGVAMF
jgi:hypothetical protein